MTVKVFISSVINASVEEVWVKIRDFNAVSNWHPAVVDSYIENSEPSDRVGCIRNINLEDGTSIRERLTVLSDLDHSCTYMILESPMPVQDYVATLRLLPITDGNLSYAEWTAEFKCPPEEEAILQDHIGNEVFQSGFESLKEIFR